ncbi:MAG: dUTP diphosphatase [Microbacteriaceae bacterium]|nr:dUTP diphosphatase [Microbacteriaceae bacterium]
MLKIKFKKLSEHAKLPTKGSLDAACFDVYAASVRIERPNKMIVGLGFATEIPKGYKGILAPRSGISKTDWILGSSIGIIDADYRGEWMAMFKCLGEMIYQPLPFGVGDRCAQIYFEKILDVAFLETEELSSTERGAGGFGSTGTK